MYKKIMHEPLKKKEFKQLYFKMYSQAKGIRIITKEERQKIKEAKKAKLLQINNKNTTNTKKMQQASNNTNPN
jgi:N-acetyl-gamma-glutamylphosphate reductase